MKVFQIFDGICYCDYSHNYRSAAEAAKYYSPETVFVDAPDYVDVGWGFDGTKEGDERFIEPPAPPEPEPGPEPEPEPTEMERIEAQVMYTALMTDTLLEEEG
ncbi:MAG: hypothetical protein IJ705_02955 [Oscillospiraceae bacterium]|nr:hypothetical protein [Oscillospiraceae bacterium]